MTHETNDPPRKPRPVDGSEIVRLAIALARAIRPGDAFLGESDEAEAALTDLLVAVRTRL